MKALSTFVNRIAGWKSFVLFLALDILFSAYILKNAELKMNALAGKPVTVIDLTFGFNPQKTLAMVADYGDAARAYYATIEMTTDVVYPIVYAFFFGIVLSLVYRGSTYVWVNILPFICLLLDYLENINIIILLKSFPEQSMAIAIFCEIAKLLKWIVFGAIILLVLTGLIRWLVLRRRA